MILKENGGDNEIKMKYYNCAATNLTLIAPYIGQATLPTNLSQKKNNSPYNQPTISHKSGCH